MSTYLLKIDETFNELEASMIKNALYEICETGLNINADQLCRSAVFLAEGNYSRFKDFVIPMINDEPRDVLDEAERRAGAPGHYFSILFPEIDSFFEQLYNEEIELEPPWDLWQE